MTQPMWTVFISHSTKDLHGGNRPGLTAKLRDRLKTDLSPHHYAVEIDEEILAQGEAWEWKLRAALDRAHVGIVLLDEWAMTRDWVRDEVKLMWHYHVLDEILFIPVLIGFTREHLVNDKHFDKLTRLSDLQMVTMTRLDKRGVDKAMEDIFDRLVRLKMDCSDDDLWWIGQVVDYLPKNDRKKVTALANLFGENGHSSQRPPFNANELLAWRMLESHLNEHVVDAVRGMKTHFTQQQPAANTALAKLLEPTWVNPEHAKQVIPEERPVRMTMVLRAGCARTAEHYVLRGTRWDDEYCEVLSLSRNLEDMPDAEGRHYRPGDIQDSLRAPVSGWLDREPLEPGDEYVYYSVLRSDVTGPDGLGEVKQVHGLSEKIIVILVVSADLPEADWNVLIGQLKEYGRCHVLPDADHDVEEQVFKNIKRIRRHLGCERLGSMGAA